MRLLLVTYYFPPSGGAGVQRTLKWVKYLRDFGVEPVVLTVEAGAYPKTDATLARDVPPGVAVHRTRSLDPFGAYARLTGRSRQQAVAETSGHLGEGASPAERFARSSARTCSSPTPASAGCRSPCSAGSNSCATSRSTPC